MPQKALVSARAAHGRLSEEVASADKGSTRLTLTAVARDGGSEAKPLPGQTLLAGAVAHQQRQAKANGRNA
jgi:hypothetical protein